MSLIRVAAALAVACTLAGCSLDRAPAASDSAGRKQSNENGGASGSAGSGAVGGNSGEGGSGGDGGSASSGGSSGEGGSAGVDGGGSAGVSGAPDGGGSGTSGSAGSGGIGPTVDGSVPMQGDAQAPKGTLYGECSRTADCEGDLVCTAGDFCARPCTESKPCSPPPTGNPTVLCIGGECSLQCGPLNVCPDGMACAFPFDSSCAY